MKGWWNVLLWVVGISVYFERACAVFMLCEFALWLFSGFSTLRVCYEKKWFFLAALYVSKITTYSS